MRKKLTPAVLGIMVIAALFLPLSATAAGRASGTMTAWGNNDSGQCVAPAGSDFVAVSAGFTHGLALKSDGSLVAWGNNDYGQCDVPAGNNFIAIAAGGLHNLALRSDGSLVAWGYNSSGQCNVPAGNDFVAVGAGYQHSLAVRSDGSLTAWGWNPNAQCNVPEGNNFVAVAGGYLHSLALKSDGSLAAWGNNVYGQCSVPQGNDFTAIAAGHAHNLALRTDGTVASWGWNTYGQCDVPQDGTFKSIAAAYMHSVACRSDGTLAAWGNNDYGQCNTPAAKDFAAVAAGGSYSLALEAPDPVRKTTSLSIDAVAPVQYSDGLSLRARLTDDAGNAVQGATVAFALQGKAGEATTDDSGIATWTATVDVAPGTYAATATYAGDTVYVGSTCQAEVSVVKENAALKYTGDTAKATNQDIALSAALDEEADGSPGDLSSCNVAFEISNPTGKVRDVQASVAQSNPGHATAAVNTEPLPAGTYTIKVRLIENACYAATDAQSGLTVSAPRVGFVTGGGLTVRDNALGIFGIAVKYTGANAGYPKGQFFFVERPFSRRQALVVASGFTSLSVDGNVATVDGACAFNYTPGYTFHLTLEDRGWFRGGMLSLTVRDTNNAVAFDAQKVFCWGCICMH